MPKYLTKSRYCLGCQCLKALWLSAWRAELAAPLDEATKHRFSIGSLIGEHARRLFNGGVLIAENHFHLPAAVASTLRHASGDAPAIFEAAAEHDRLLCRADVLKRVTTDAWDLIEVKMSTTVKEEHIPDVAIQYHCFTQAGFKIRKCLLMHVNRAYVRNGPIDPSKLLATDDITPLVQKFAATIDLVPFFAAMDAPECPEVAPGDQCLNPYKCSFYDLCNPPQEDYTIHELSRATKAIATLNALGIKYLKDVPNDFPLSDRQRLTVQSNKTAEPVINRQGIKNFLDTLTYPLNYFDFETINPAIPLFDKSRPYQVVPFQFSLDVQNEPSGACIHHEFLLEDRRDPRRELVEAMLKPLLENAGSILAFNMNFEIQRIQDLAETFPEYRAKLLSLVPRFRDLIIPFRSGHFVHRDFHGSNSLKFIQPVLVPHLSYKALEIQEGETASLKYELFASGEMPQAEWEKTREDLLRYCGLDTGAMVEIVRVLMAV